jgi:hypothetical protein
MDSRQESEYDWAILPEDLPKRNLVLITAKTPHPTFHKEDKKFPVRLFTSDELFEAARSLAHRPVGLNHLGLIEKAFTVDAQFNKSTGNVEALLYFPDEWVGKVKTLLNEGKESIFSVEYTWRDEKYTAEGVEFIGLIFDKVDLLCGLNAGDKFTSAKLVESAIEISGRRACMESVGAELIQQEQITTEDLTAGLTFFKECEAANRLGEPFAGYQDFSACVAANKDKGDPDAYCGYIKHKTEAGYAVKNPSTGPEMADRNEEAVMDLPEKTNLLNNDPQTPISNQDPSNVDKPVVNVASAGFVQDEKGFVGGEPAKGALDFTMAGNQNPAEPMGAAANAKECGALSPDNSNQDTYKKIESGKSMSESNPEIKPEDKKVVPKEEPKQEPVPDPKLVEAEKKLSESAAKITALETEKAALNTRVKELEPAFNKLQEAAKTYDSSIAKAEAKGRTEGKKEIISKVSKVIPSSGFFSDNHQGAARVLINDVKKVLYESENSK